jgi:hypothetical protein
VERLHVSQQSGENRGGRRRRRRRRRRRKMSPSAIRLNSLL